MNKKELIDILHSQSETEHDNFIICSGNIYTFESAINEILTYQKDARIVKWLSFQSAIMYLPLGYHKLCEKIKTAPPVFIQHISPIQYVFDIENTDILQKNILENYEVLDKNKPFSVQLTDFSKVKKNNSYEISKSISEALISKGYKLNVKNPYNVVSIAIDEDKIYLGISIALRNLSKWACGITYYKKELNRAEYKLLECIDYFKLTLAGKSALDIGAAPGGWTKALVDRGYKVWAVDPAMLDEEIQKNSNVTHMKMSAQHFIKNNEQYFDIIVNDMILDCRESARIMNDTSKYLSQDGICIMTAKLPKQGYNKRLKTAIAILKDKFSIMSVRQLPSNKSEVTIVLSKKE